MFSYFNQIYFISIILFLDPGPKCKQQVMKETTGGFYPEDEAQKGTNRAINILECKKLCLRLKSCRSIQYCKTDKECHTYGTAPHPLKTSFPNHPCSLYVKSCGRNYEFYFFRYLGLI